MQYIFRKLTASDVEARVQSADSNGFMLLIYKNARVDQNILDETVGAFGWQDKYEEFKGNLYCSIGIKDKSTNEWIWKSNCGTESKTEAEKGEASDAFKRAGFNWGIGRELYTSPKIKIKGHVEEKGQTYKPEYYEFTVDTLEVSDARKITALKIIGKSMLGGYHEDVIFDWTEKSVKTAIKSEKKQSVSDNTTKQENEPQTSQNTAQMTLGQAESTVISFGKYKGSKMEDVENSYLEYLADKAFDANTKQAARMTLDNRARQIVTSIPIDDDNLPF